MEQTLSFYDGLGLKINSNVLNLRQNDHTPSHPISVYSHAVSKVKSFPPKKLFKNQTENNVLAGTGAIEAKF